MAYRAVDADERAPSPEDHEAKPHAYSSHPAYLYQPPAGLPPDTHQLRPSQSHKSLFTEWPVQAQRVWTITPFRISVIVFEAVLASTPIIFITLALIAARLDGQDASKYGEKLRQALLLSPTLFPVIFAALMGRSFKAVGLYLAERGTTLGRLEQLVGCQSLFSALERQFFLRSWSLLGLLMVLLWLLSPLGGQSALRLLGSENNIVNSSGTVQYLSPNAVYDSFTLGASALNSGLLTYPGIFLAALLSSSKYQYTSMDLWGNVKLPTYRSIEDSSSEEWKTVPNATETNITYASLIGVPVVNNYTTGLSNFTVKARQWDITCDSNRALDSNATDFGALSTTYKLNFTDPNRCKGYPCPFSFKSLANDDRQSKNYSVAACKLSYDYLEARISCIGTECAATALRKLDLLTDGYSSNEDDFIRSTQVANIMIALPKVDNTGGGATSSRGSTNSEKWMRNPDRFIGADYDYVNLYELPVATFASRLTMIWNTFHQSTYATTVLGGNLPQNLTTLASTTSSLRFNKSTISISQTTARMYKTNWGWFAVLLVSSIILQIAAYIGLVLKYYACAPDIIGYASSMTLLNPYVPTRTGGTTLHGLERAALLQDLPVQIGDVCADESIGAIAFAKIDKRRVGRLNRLRFYV